MNEREVKPKHYLNLRKRVFEVADYGIRISIGGQIDNIMKFIEENNMPTETKQDLANAICDYYTSIQVK